MKRAQIVEANKPLVISEVAIPEAPPGGLVIKTSYGGICHTDLHQWEDSMEQGQHGRLRFTENFHHKLPVVPGHEISGTVYSLGKGGEEGPDPLKIGDRVAAYPWTGCGQCGCCKNGCTDFCPATHMWLGFGPGGGYGSFVVVSDKRYALKVPENIPLDVACMFSCSTLTAFNAVRTTLPVVERAITFHGKAKALIIGAGGLGLWAVQIARAMFPTQCSISAADVNEGKLQIAKERGCDATVFWDTKKSTADLVADSVKGGHYDAVIDFVNNSITTDRAFKCLNRQGMLTMVGLFGGEANYSLPMMVLACQQVRGVLVGSLQCMKDMISFAAKNQLVPPPMEHIKLEGATDALERLRQGKVKGRVIIDFTK